MYEPGLETEEQILARQERRRIEREADLRNMRATRRIAIGIFIAGALIGSLVTAIFMSTN